MSKFGFNKASLLIASIFALLYAAISLVNHYLLRTDNLDLGLYTNAVWDYAHFQFNYGECLNHYRENLLHDHFDLYLLLFSPLSYIFKSYTLLVVQIAAVVLCGLGMYKLTFLLIKKVEIALLMQLFFYGFFGIYSALAYDYHSNVVAAMVLPWFVLALLRWQFVLAWLLLIFIIVAKENMSLWMVFVCLGFSFLWFKDKTSRFQLFFMAIFSSLYFVLILNVVMPALTRTGKYIHFDYNILGENMGEAIKNLLLHPWYYFQYLWMNQNTEIPEVSVIKAEFWMFLALSGGLLLLRKPIFIFMMIPLFFQKFYNSRDAIWGINDQYAIEFAPILAIGIIYVLQTIKSYKWKRYLAIIAVLASGIMGFTSLENSHKGAHNVKGRFYRKEHYISKNAGRIKEALKLIPSDAAVVGSSNIMAQLAYRDKAYRLPQIEFANYFVHCCENATSPLSAEKMDALITQLLLSNEWEVLVYDELIILLKRKKCL